MILKPLVFLAGAAAMMFSPSAEASLRVGAAKVDTTGPLGASQTGKYDHEHVYARAIVIENGSARSALITYEGPEFGFDMSMTRKAVAAKLGAPLENIIITHTHVHSPTSTPHAMFIHGYATPMIASPDILTAVDHAVARLQSAKMGYGNGSLYLNVNRDSIDPVTRQWTQGPNPDGPSDKTVRVLTFEKLNGEPIAAYVSYAMHPVQGFMLDVVTGDFPEAMSSYVEKALGNDSVVAFSQSNSGDVNPLYLRLSTAAMSSRIDTKSTPLNGSRKLAEGTLFPLEMSAANGGAPVRPADPKAIDALFRLIDAEGVLFGEEVLRVINDTTDFQSDARIRGHQETVTCPSRTRVTGSNFDFKSREGTMANYVDAPPIDLHVGMLGIGTFALVSVNTEIYTMIGKRVMDFAPMKNTMIVALANERVRGYIPDDASYGHLTFQVLNASLKPGCAETGISNAVLQMQNRYLSGQ